MKDGARSLGSSKAKPKGKQKPSWDRRKEEARLARLAADERRSWLERPRIFRATFEGAWKDDKIKNLVEKLGGKVSTSKDEEQRRIKRKQEIEALAKGLGWSNARLSFFKALLVLFRKNPSIEIYLKIRRRFPEVEIDVSEYADVGLAFSLGDELEKIGVPPLLIASALDGDEPSIDALSLRLLTLLASRDRLPKKGPGSINKRREAISDAIVNYLIVIMLETFDYNEVKYRIPGSLIVLIRRQLCASVPDFHAAYLLKDRMLNVAIGAAQLLRRADKLSVRKLAAMAGIPPTTAARWLKDENFKSTFQAEQSWRTADLEHRQK